MAKRYKKLTFEDRRLIEQLTAAGTPPKEIAKKTDVCFQTIYRELARGRDESGTYKAEIAQKALFC